MKKWIIILAGIIIAGIAGLAVIFFFFYNKPHPDYEKMDAAYSLKASELYQAFTTGRQEAEKKFNGQVVEISGIPAKLEDTDSLVVAVFVFNQGMFGDEGIRCTLLPGAHAKARGMSPATEVKIKGYCTGFNDTDVILEQCSINQ
jgi:hypothetical protein